jgi:hypothetical protein
LFLTGRRGMLALFNLSKEDYKGWANGLRRAGYHRPQISREAHIIYWALWFGTLWCHCYGKTILHLKSKTLAAFDSQNRSLYEVQKEILCIPYQKI